MKIFITKENKKKFKLFSMKKIAVLDIQGGFGNQIFQFAFAFFLKSKGYKIFLNYEYFQLENSRSLVFKDVDFNFQKVTKLQIFLFKLLNKLSLSNKIPGVIKKYLSKYFLKIKSAENFKQIKKLPPYILCRGYFQDLSYLDSFRPEFENYLNKKGNKKNSENYHRVLLHIRRTDYLNMGEELKLDFYTKALSYCYENISDFRYDIFTDDIDWVKNQSIFKSASSIFHKKEVHSADKASETLDTFLDMLNYDTYIVGNSTYSLMAYEFSHADEKKIIAARPWFRDRSFGNIYPKDSIFIENS